MSMDNKEYLGDSVYVELDYGAIVLTTEDGMVAGEGDIGDDCITNVIVLEPEVMEALIRYYQKPVEEAEIEEAEIETETEESRE